jgi:fatty-acyl-CoA synthase
MLGLMQDWPMTLDRLIRHAEVMHPGREVVTRTVEGPIVRTNYAEIARRARRLSNALIDDKIQFGDRVATLAWNTARHMETWYGAMGIGAVLHTLNPRLLPDQIAWIANHAGDRIIFVDLTFVPLLEQVADKLPGVERFVIYCDRAHMPKTALKNALPFEDYIEGRSEDATWGGFDENTAAGLCYTSGTTGQPKGVLYSHRSNMLHALLSNQGDVFGLKSLDVVLAVVPMFHANSWGLAFSAPMSGSKLVFPGARLDPASIYELIDTEGVTCLAGVPTVWNGLADYMQQNKLRFSKVRRIVIGGAAASGKLIETFENEFGVEVVHAWGMTEMSPIGTWGGLNWKAAETLTHEQQLKLKQKQGRQIFGVELRIADDAGRERPHDGKAFGRLLAHGPAVAKAYFKGEGARNERGEVLEPCGFFDTGDIATLDEDGYLQITDRAKDVIKSGGEWISTQEIENIASGAPGVALAAVIGMPHPKWDERPLLIVEPKPGATPKREDVLAFLDGKIAKWWTPDDVVTIEKMPLGATGKVNKLALRETFKGYRLPGT